MLDYMVYRFEQDHCSIHTSYYHYQRICVFYSIFFFIFGQPSLFLSFFIFLDSGKKIKDLRKKKRRKKRELVNNLIQSKLLITGLRKI